MLIIWGSLLFLGGLVTGYYLCDKWWNKSIDRNLTKITQTDEQLMKRLGMAAICRACGCQEWDNPYNEH